MAFDPQRALQYAQTLAFPRRVGTPGETRALALITERLTRFGYAVERQPFTCSTGADVAFALLIGLGQVLIILTFWAYSGPAWLAVLPALALAALLLNANSLSRRAAQAVLAPEAGAAPSGPGRLGRRFTTANLVAHAPASVPGRPHLLLVAHWDSKSQALPLVVRMALLAVAGASGLLFVALTAARVALPSLTGAAAVCGLLALLAAVPVLLLYLVGAGNVSPGAVDNASGVGLLLYLAEHFAAEPPAINLTFLSPGAEELGVLGAAAYVRAWRAAGGWPPSGVHVLNLDGVGTDGPLAYVAAETAPLTGLVKAACGALGLTLNRLPLVGAMFDHLPFADAGLDALSLVTTGSATRAAHTPGDSAQRLNQRGFEQAGAVVLRVVELLAQAEPGG
jgi:hypothetical protein